eukprot:167089_1
MIAIVFVVSIFTMLNCATTQLLPQPLMNSIISATPHYSQNAFNPNLYSLLLTLLGQSFQSHSQSIGVPQAFNTFWGAFQTSLNQPQSPYSNIYNQMIPNPYTQIQCCAPHQSNDLVQLLPLILSQHNTANQGGEQQNMWQMLMAQQLLMQMHNYWNMQPKTNDNNADTSSDHNDQNILIQNLMKMVMQNQQLQQDHDHNNNNNDQIILLLSQILNQVNDKQPKQPSHDSKDSDDKDKNQSKDMQLLLQLSSMLTSKTNKHPFTPIIVGTQKNSVYDALLTFLSEKASKSTNTSMSTQYKMIMSWLTSHHNELSSHSLEEIMFRLLHSQISTGSSYSVSNNDYGIEWLNNYLASHGLNSAADSSVVSSVSTSTSSVSSLQSLLNSLVQSSSVVDSTSNTASGSGELDHLLSLLDDVHSSGDSVQHKDDEVDFTALLGKLGGSRRLLAHDWNSYGTADGTNYKLAEPVSDIGDMNLFPDVSNDWNSYGTVDGANYATQNIPMMGSYSGDNTNQYGTTYGSMYGNGINQAAFSNPSIYNTLAQPVSDIGDMNLFPDVSNDWNSYGTVDGANYATQNIPMMG